MAFRVTVLDMDSGEERVFVRNACGVICAVVMPKEGEEDKYDGTATAYVAENVPIGTAGLLVRLAESSVKHITDADGRIRQKMDEDDGLEFQATTRGENLSIVMLAQCLDGVDRAVKKNCTDDAAVRMAYTLVKMGVMGDSLVDVEGETEEMSSSIKAHCGAEEVQA